MAKSFLLEPADAVERLATRYRNQRKHWLAGGGDWSLTLSLGAPTEQQALAHLTQVRAWQAQWADWKGSGTLRWSERRWPALGTQRVPEALVLESADQLAELIGTSLSWQRARARHASLLERWPALADLLPSHFAVLAEWDDSDYNTLLAVLAELAANDWRGHYLRELPIPGIDSKWLETRQGVLGRWLGRIRNEDAGQDLHTQAGLRRPPQTLRLRLLDSRLRGTVGGLGDIQAPLEDLARLDIGMERAIIVENLQTGLAFPDLPGTALFMKQGYAVDLLGQLPWLATLPLYYWGDIDTHGFAILDRLRAYLPQARSLLMDAETLLRHRPYWAVEPKPAAHALTRLTNEEQALYQDLQRGRYGGGVRLEQERIGWGHAQLHLAALASGSA